MHQGTITRRRIVVTLDSAQVEPGDLECLLRLADRLDADLEGVFVEDSDLLRLADMTFLREFRPTSQRAESFQSGRMQQELRVMARRAERALAEVAERRGVAVSFRTWRGSIERELLRDIEADILAVMRLGAIAFQPSRRRAPELVSACFDGSDESARALAMAADLATDNDGILLQVIMIPGPDAESDELHEHAASLLAEHSGNVVYRFLEDNTVGGLLEMLYESGSTALVMQRDNSMLRNTSLRQYLSRLQCPLFLVR
ncbi:MAG: universal stress protein [Gammaproteobacteria bacterium]|nr:universal stress protein [Gammaproteobacteria bacterium]